MFIIAFFMLNQYVSTSAAIAPSLASLNDPGAAAALGATAQEIESTKQLLASTSGALLSATAMDFVLGIVLFGGGLFLYPKEKA